MEDLDLEHEEEKKKLESSKYELSIATTGTFFLLFLVPISFGIFGFPINLYQGVSVAIHEVGHPLFHLLSGGDGVIGALGGTLFEYLNPLVAVIYFARKKRGAVLAFIFLACMGSAMPWTAAYMESAGNPWGETSYFGALLGQHNDMSTENHDWHIVFSAWNLMGKEHIIASYVRGVGEVFVLIGVIASVFGFWFLLNYNPADFSELILMGSVPAALYFVWEGALLQLTLSLLFVLSGVIWLGVKRIRRKKKAKIEYEKRESSS